MRSRTACILLLAAMAFLTLMPGYALAETVAKPAFSPAPGTYTSAQTVRISSSTSGATIRYTLDKKVPTASSARYERPLTVEKTTTINAQAFKSGMSDSEMASATYTINLTVATPTFNPKAGTYTTEQRISIFCATPGATIRFTTDGSEPTSGSSAYAAPIPVAKSVTIKARGFKSGQTDSDVASAAYTINLTVATPTFNPKAGTYTTEQRISIFCATQGATIRFTTDGSEPTSRSSAYAAPIPVAKSVTIKARGFKSGQTDSDVASAAYTINLTVATPTFNPNAGTYTSAQNVRISCATPGATIRYTTDSTDPTTASAIYSTPIAVSTTTTIKAQAFKSGIADSPIATAKFTIKPYVATPTFSPKPGNYASAQTISISCATAGATIRYTANGSTPGATSTIYSSPIAVANTTAVRARAFKNDMTDSPVATAVYVIGAANVVLLLHDMDSGPEAWNDFVMAAGYGPANTLRSSPMPIVAPAIYAGVIKGNEQAAPDLKGVFYFRLKFGSKDASLERVGAEKSCRSTGKEGDSGDFSLMGQLAREVNDGVRCIINAYPGARIALVGHGRGGLAARAFLQSSEPSDEMNAVAALLTTGTPHSGTPLGRIFHFLSVNPRGTPLSADWQVVDALRGVGWQWPFLIDLRRPTMSDQAPESAAIADLQRNAANLSQTVAYGTQCYDKIPLGKLSLLSKSILEGFMGLPPLTANARNEIYLGAPASQSVGDGIVPLASQTFRSQQITITNKVNSSGRVVHGAEPAQVADLRALLEVLVPWWK